LRDVTKPTDADAGEIARLKAENAALRSDLADVRELKEALMDRVRRSYKFSHDEYRLMLACLSPDGCERGSKIEAWHEKAFKIFTDKMPEKFYREKKPDPQMPKDKGPPDLPSTMAEWDALKRSKKRAKRSAKPSSPKHLESASRNGKQRKGKVL